MKKFRNVIIGYLCLTIFAFLLFEINKLESTQQAVAEMKKKNDEYRIKPLKRDWVGEGIDKPSLTAKGGFEDATTFIRDHFEKEEAISKGYGAAFELGNIRLLCRSSYTGRCNDALYYFKENPNTVEEAFLQLKDHLPPDSVIKNEFQLNKERYVYNLTSLMFDENYKTNDRFYQGEFSLEFIKDENGKIFTVVPLLEHLDKNSK